MRGVCLLVLGLIGAVLSIEHDYKGFDDSILFGINWPGAQEALENLVDGEAKPQVMKFILQNIYVLLCLSHC